MRKLFSIGVVVLACVSSAFAQGNAQEQNDFLNKQTRQNEERVIVTDSAVSLPTGDVVRFFVVRNLSNTSKALMYHDGILKEIEPGAGYQAEALFDQNGKVLDYTSNLKAWSLSGRKEVNLVYQTCDCRVKLNYATVGLR